jgi:hypothetical protein
MPASDVKNSHNPVISKPSVVRFVALIMINATDN